MASATLQKPVEIESRELNVDHLALAIRAVSDYPGPGQPTGMAVDIQGNIATRVEGRKVRLCLVKRGGGSSRYLFEVPEVIRLPVIIVEE